MKVEMRRYVGPVGRGDLPRLLSAPVLGESEPIGITADLTELERVFRELSPEPGEGEKSAWDAQLVEPMHRALRLSHRLAADMRFWHWLCVARLPHLVWYRWHGSVPESPSEVLAMKPALAERFIGSPTLRGVSRNTLARLWWCGESLYSEDDGYNLAREALSKQDLFQAIFERKFGVYPPAARACIRTFKGAAEKHWRNGTLRLNHILTTIVLETLTEENIVALLSQWSQ